MCIKNKNYMENWLFWGLNLGNLKQCMMIMLVLTSSSSAWTLCSLLHISSLINICNFYSFWATGMVLTSKWGRILQEIHCQCQIWLNCAAAGRKPANFHKRNYLLSVNTTDFEKTTIQAFSALSQPPPTAPCSQSWGDAVCAGSMSDYPLCTAPVPRHRVLSHCAAATSCQQITTFQKPNLNFKKSSYHSLTSQSWSWVMSIHLVTSSSCIGHSSCIRSMKF